MSESTSTGTSTGTAGEGTAAAEGTQQAQGGQDPTSQQQAPTAPNAQQQAAGTGDGTGEGTQNAADTIARLETELAAARAEAGKSRVTAKQRAADDARADLTQQLLGILDPSRAGQPATPEQLTAQLTQAQESARTTAVELAVYRTAQAAGANPDALLDSRAFASAVAALDPSDNTAITAAIQAAVTANPRLAAQAQQGPARGGAEFNGAPSGGVNAQQFAAMDYAGRADLFQSDPDTYRRLAGS
ncbi:hypothetical protein ACFVAQ_45095 [Streptomyces sp. NPDC057651]|uniref:hypothetical protein n=1 Tax=Streptomyces sp. NPDC057651 TaxID=3346194 RepID=UPI0036ACA0AF